MSQQREVELVVGGWDDDPAEIAGAGDRLCEELDLLDFDRRDRPAIPSESGTRAGAAVAAGTLVGSPGFPGRSARRRRRRQELAGAAETGGTIKIGDDSIELTAATRGEQDALVQAFLHCHAGS